MFWTDGQVDTDVLLDVAFGDAGTTLTLGWRTTSIPLVTSRQWHEKLLLGATARIPGIDFLGVRPRLGVELSTVIFKHGGGLPTDTLSFGEPGGYLDFVNFALFLRFDYEG